MIRVRIAPSPTGLAHIGTAYTALFNYAFAKKNKGKFVLRIEDTDKDRYVAGSEKVIYEGLKWLGLDYDEGPDVGGKFGPYIQSKRLSFYKQYAEELVKKGKAYYCFCTSKRLAELRKKLREEKKPPMYDGKCRSLTQGEVRARIKQGEKYVIRLKIPRKGTTSFIDEIRGRIVVENKIIDDQILLKSDGYPTYHLAVVVDDHLMRITHVIRAEEWLSSVPKHVLLYNAFGWPLPKFIHLPLLRNPDRSKISKRKNPISLLWYRKQGFLPEAILNYLALLGWSHPKEKETFSLEEFIKNFDFKRIHPVGPVFDLKKLQWINGVYIRKTSDEKLVQLILAKGQSAFGGKPFVSTEIKRSLLKKIVPLIKERITRLSEVNDFIRFFFKTPSYEKQLFKGERVKEELVEVVEVVKRLDKWAGKEIYKEIKKICEKGKYNKKQFYVNLYIAIEGRESGLPLFESMELLGKKEALLRLKKAFLARNARKCQKNLQNLRN